MESTSNKSNRVTQGPFKRWIKRHRNVYPILQEDDFIQYMFNAQYEIREPRNLKDLVELLEDRDCDWRLIELAKKFFLRWQSEDPKAPKDGFSTKDKERIRKACRQVWGWSHPRKICVERATNEKGFVYCENKTCESAGRPVPRIHVDHITPVGEVDGGFLERLFCPSGQLQALCKRCHDAKTKEERAKLKMLKSVKKDTRNFTDDF